MSDPERLRPGETREMVTERAAATFAELAQSLPRPGTRSAGGGALREPPGVLHVRRGRGAAPGRHVHEDAGAGAATARRFHGDGGRPVRRDGGEGRTGRLRAGGVVQRRAVRRRCRPAAGAGRDRHGAQGGGARLVGDRPVDPGDAVREGPGPGQALAARRALHRPRQDHAHRRSGHRPSPCWRNGRSKRGRSPPPSRRRTRRGRYAGAAGRDR